MRIVEPITISDSGGFSRASTAPYWDKNGVLQTAAIDEPRWDYDPLTGEFRGLLIEASSSNFTTSSDDISSSDWNKTSATVTANAAVAPDGNMVMDKLIGAAATTSHYVDNTVGMSSLSDNVYCSASVYVKKADFGRVQLTFVTKNGNGPSLEFRFSDKRVTYTLQGAGQSGVTFDYEECPGGVFRLKIKGVNTLTGGLIPRPRVLLADDIGIFSWSKTGSPIITNNSITSPVPGWLADSFVEPAASGQFYTSTTLNLRAGIEAKYDAYVQPVAGSAQRYVVFGHYGSSAFNNIGQYSIVDLVTGSITATSGAFITFSVSAVSGGWWKITATMSPQATGSAQWRIQLSNSPTVATPTYTGDGISGFHIAAPYAYETVLDKGYGIFNASTVSSVTGDGVKGTYVWRVMTEPGMDVTSSIQTTSSPVTRAADVWSGMMLTNIVENDYAEWNNATAYLISDRVMVTTAAYHNIYQSITNNTNKNPTLELDPINSPVDWQFVSKTNRWKPFDGYQSSQATIATEMIYSLRVPDSNIVDSIVLYNVNGYQARIIITDDVEGVVYEKTVILVSDSGITDYWEYCFTPLVRLQTLVLTGLPAYSGQRIDLQLLDEGGNPALGAFIVGLSQDIGYTQYGMQISSTDYSVKKIDDFGNITLTQRPYSDELLLNSIVQNTDLAAIKNLFTRLRATPIVVIGAEDVYDEASAAFCIIESWSESVNYPNETLLAFKGKGLT